jgi:hypothetical protein
MRHGRPRQGGRSVAIATGIRRGPTLRIESARSHSAMKSLFSPQRVELAAAHSGRPRLRPLATIHARSCSRARRQAPPQVIHFALSREVAPRCICAVRAAQRRATARMELSAPSRFCGTEPNRGQAIVGSRIAGRRQHRCQSTAAFRRESVAAQKRPTKRRRAVNERRPW